MNTFLIAAITQDGYLAQDVDQTSTDWTSAEDKKFFRDRTKDAGVVVMGRKTFDTVGKLLPGRVNIVMSRNAEIGDMSYEFGVEILDQELDKVDTKKLYFTKLSPRDVVSKIKALGFSELAVCGGASVYKQFLEAGLLDTLYLTVEPVQFGSGISLFGDDSSDQLALPDFNLEIPAKLNLSTMHYSLQDKMVMNEKGTLLVTYERLR